MPPLFLLPHSSHAFHTVPSIALEVGPLNLARGPEESGVPEWILGRAQTEMGFGAF